MTKKILVSLLSLVLVFSLTACKKDTKNDNTVSTPKNSTASNLKSDAENLGSDIKSGAEDLGSDIKSGAEETGSKIKEGAEDFKSGVESFVEGDTTSVPKE